MFQEARKRLRKEFDIIELVRHLRKLNLIKLCILRQYQRRSLKYSKKSLIKPPDPTKKKKEEQKIESIEKHEDLENLSRLAEGAGKGDKIDQKILKNLLNK